MEIGREIGIYDAWYNLATALDVKWSGRDKRHCFLDDWKHVVQFTELGRSERRTAGLGGKPFDSV